MGDKNQEPQVFLWDHPVSSYAQKIRLALREKGVPFQFETPKGIGTGFEASTDAAFWNSNNRIEVPVLIDGDLKIFDSTVILEYIEDKWPEPALLPPRDQAAARAKARMIEDVCDTQYEAINWAVGEVDSFKRAEGELAQKLKAQAAHQTKQIQGWLAQQLGSSDWFGGDRFGWADLCVAPILNRSVVNGMGPDPGSPLAKWHARLCQRPAVQETFNELTAALRNTAALGDALKKGLLKREYRDHRLEWMVKSGGLEIVLDGLKKDNIRFSWPDPLP